LPTLPSRPHTQPDSDPQPPANNADHEALDGAHAQTLGHQRILALIVIGVQLLRNRRLNADTAADDEA
jgi:hypothetical protein